MMLRMLSVSSLSAFSAVPQVSPAAGHPGPRTAYAQPKAAAAEPPLATRPPAGGHAPPPRLLPRGSLLDLSA